jgi:hypothetical protein
MYIRGKRTIQLTDREFNELRTRLEKEFNINRKRIDGSTTYYELSSNINNMNWIDSGTIELTKFENKVRIKFSVSSLVKLFFIIILQASGFGYTYLSGEDSGMGMWASLFSFILYPLLFILTYIAFKLVQLRISNKISLTVAARDYQFSKEQLQWVNDPNRCPACGENDVTNKAVCPDCGLSLR